MNADLLGMTPSLCGDLVFDLIKKSVLFSVPSVSSVVRRFGFGFGFGFGLGFAFGFAFAFANY